MKKYDYFVYDEFDVVLKKYSSELPAVRACDYGENQYILKKERPEIKKTYGGRK